MTNKLPFLSDDHHFAIASVAVRVSQMEWLVETLIHTAMLHQLQTAKFALKNLGADRIVGFLKAILLDRYPNEFDATNNLIAEINRIKSERNEILHWIWGKTDNPDKAAHLSARPFRQQERKTKTAAEIQQIADDAMKVVEALIWWSNHIHRFVLAPLHEPAKPSPDTPSMQSPPRHSPSTATPDQPDRPPPLGPQLHKPQG